MSHDQPKIKTAWLPQSPASGQIPADPLAIDAFDHIEIYCGNARQSAYYYSNIFGLSPIAYRGPETGHRTSASYVLKANNLCLVLTSPLRPNHALAHGIQVHGDHAGLIALEVENCEAFYHEAMKRGAKSSEVPMSYEDAGGVTKRAAIHTYGETILAIIERHKYSGHFWPGFMPFDKYFPAISEAAKPVGLMHIDHVVGNVELGRMEHWVNFYERVLGFTQMIHFSDKEISTEYSALMSKVMRNGTGKIKFPINEPAHGRKKSQIEEYLDFNYGPGVQHVALLTNDIIATVTEMRRRGLNFLKVPQTYYDEVPNRVGKIKEDLKKIAELGILADRDDDGYLLQIFTKPVQDRPTLFFEVIQREGSQGFGVGNFKALFEAIERDQAQRGNL